MPEMNGVIGAVARHGKSFKLEGNDAWYSMFNESQMNGCVKGDTVSFQYTEKGAYKNIKGNVRKDATAAPAASTGGSGGGWKGGNTRTFPVGSNAPERTINRQNALTNAIAFWSMNANMGPMPEEFNEQHVIDTARVFEAYTTGDLDEMEKEAALAELTKGS